MRQTFWCLGILAYMPSRTAKHGWLGTPTYQAWAAMKNRCLCKTSRDYPRWGGRGIRVCDQWIASFENFLADMGPRPSGKHSLDRIDNNGNYVPGNVRWATWKEQQSNRSSTTFVVWKGERKTVSDWARALDIHQATLWRRLRDWPLQRAMTEPPTTRPKRMFTLNGQTMCMSEWARAVGITQVAMLRRLKKWPVEIALTSPPGARP